MNMRKPLIWLLALWFLCYCIVPQKDEQDLGYTLPVWIVNYEVDASIAHASLYFGFAISALNGANIHLD